MIDQFFGIVENLRLTSEGVWLSNETEITHEQSIKAFFKYLRRDEQGYLIQIGKEIKRIEVEDTPFFVASLEGSDLDGYELVLLGGERIPLDPQTLQYSPGRLVCAIRGFEAKFLRSAYHQLLGQSSGGLQQDERGYFLRICGARIDI